MSGVSSTQRRGKHNTRGQHHRNYTKKKKVCKLRKTQNQLANEKKRVFFLRSVCGKGGRIKQLRKNRPSLSFSQASFPFWFSPHKKKTPPNNNGRPNKLGGNTSQTITTVFCLIKIDQLPQCRGHVFFRRVHIREQTTVTQQTLG